MQASIKLIPFFALQGSSSDSEGEAGEEGAKSFLKKKPEVTPDASKFLKGAKGSGVRGHIRMYYKKPAVKDLILMC